MVPALLSPVPLQTGRQAEGLVWGLLFTSVYPRVWLTSTLSVAMPGSAHGGLSGGLMRWVEGPD